MGKHDSGYARVERDYYPTPGWVVEALAEYVDLEGRDVWECACGDGRMAEALKRLGARVYATDIEDRGYAGLSALRDFIAVPEKYPRDPRIITNPPLGDRHAKAKLGLAFIDAGLHYVKIARRGLLALLLPADFDSYASRRHLFADCNAFAAKIVLTKRIVWYERHDGEREAPKENHAWFVWRLPRPTEYPMILYAPSPR
jgi:predicted RNA methylase